MIWPHRESRVILHSSICSIWHLGKQILISYIPTVKNHAVFISFTSGLWLSCSFCFPCLFLIYFPFILLTVEMEIIKFCLLHLVLLKVVGLLRFRGIKRKKFCPFKLLFTVNVGSDCHISFRVSTVLSPFLWGTHPSGWVLGLLHPLQHSLWGLLLLSFAWFKYTLFMLNA